MPARSDEGIRETNGLSIIRSITVSTTHVCRETIVVFHKFSRMDEVTLDVFACLHSRFFSRGFSAPRSMHACYDVACVETSVRTLCNLCTVAFVAISSYESRDSNLSIHLDLTLMVATKIVIKFV